MFVELADNQPVNKHRETQLKLQEKLREKLLSKQQGSRWVCPFTGNDIIELG